MNFQSTRYLAIVIFILGNFLARPAFSQCDFNFIPANPCPGETVTFNVINPMTGSTYKWDLDGDGSFDDGVGSTVTFTYPYSNSPKSYAVKLQRDGGDCPNSKIVMVEAGLQPTLYVNSGQGQPIGGVIKICGSGQSNDVIVSNNTPPGNPSSTVYTIQWETNGPIESFPATQPATTVSHSYTSAGYHDITLTATLPNGCILINKYKCFKGGTPSAGLESDSFPSILCLPYQLLFRVTNYINNPPGTTYKFTKNGQVISPIFQQETLPSPFTFSYNFTESTCGGTTPNGIGGQYQNATAIYLVVSNPCDEKTFFVSPIRVVSKPVPDFSIQHPLYDCPNEVFTFSNTSTDIHEILDLNGPCVEEILADWMISGTFGVDWTIVSGDPLGNQTIKIKFLKPGNYAVTMTLNPTPICGPAKITKTITVLDPPQAIAVVEATPSTGCSPLTVKFKNNSTGYQPSYNWHISPGNGWSWQAPNSGTGDISTTEPTAVFNAPGEYKVTLTVTNVCSTSMWTTTIKVKDKPGVTLPNFGPFCQTAALDFSAPNAPTFNANFGTISAYQWNFPGGTPSSFTGPNPPTINYGPIMSAQNFTYSVSATNECGTTAVSKTFEIQVPAIITLPPDLTVCIDKPAFQITPFTPANGTWTGPGVSTNGLFNPANAGGAGVKILTYTYGAQGSPCTATKTMKITIIPLPVVGAGIDQKLCINSASVSLSGSPASPPGGWTSSPATAGLSGQIFNPTVSGVGVFNLTYNYTDTAGCKNSDQMTINVNPLPNINVGNASFCNVNQDLDLPSATPSGGTWSGPGVVNNKFNPQSAGGLGAYQVTYTYTDSSTGCSNSKTITVSVVALETINAGPDKEFCLNAPQFNLNSDATNATGGIWSVSPNTPGVLSGNFFNPTASGTYNLTLKKGTGVCEVNDTRTIVVYSLPPVDVPSVAQSCIDQTTFALPPSTPPYPSGIWTSNPAGLVTGNNFIPADAGVSTVALVFSVTDSHGCSNFDQLTMTVNPLPDITVYDVVFCKTPGNVTLPTAAPTGGVWSGTGIIPPDKFDPLTPGGPDFQATYTYTNSITGCTNSETAVITITNPDDINAGVDRVFCLNAPSFNLDSDATPSSGGQWSGQGVSGNTFTPATAGVGTHTVTLKIGSGNCEVSDSRVIKVNPLPSVDVAATAQSCISETAVQLISNPATGGIWVSNPPGLVSGDMFNASVAGEGVFILTFTFTDADNCSNSAQMAMSVHPLPDITVGDTVYCNTPGAVSLPSPTPISGGIGTWSGPGVSNGKFDPQAAGGVGTYQATYSFTNSLTGCTSSKNIKIEVINPDNVDAGADKVFCLNDPPFNLYSDAVPGSGGVWTGLGISGNTFNPMEAGAGTHAIHLTVGTGNCAVQDERIIRVNPLPTVDVPTAAQSCVSETMVLLPATIPATGGTWSSNPPGLVSGTNFNAKMAGVGTATLIFNFIDANGCTNSDQLTMTVNALPIVAVQNEQFCNTPGGVTLIGSSTQGGSWSGLGITDPDGGIFNPQGAGGVGIYSEVYTYTDANGCTNRDTAIIEVIAPVAVYGGRDTAICADITDFDLYSGGVFPASNDVWSGTGVSGSIFNAQIAGVGEHNLTYEYGIDNCKVSATRKIKVNPLPDVAAGPDGKACVSETAVNLTPSPANGVWAGGSAVISGNVLNPNASGAGVFSLIYTFTDANGCTNSDEIEFIVNQLPVPMSVDTSFCNTPGFVVMPQATPSVGGIGWWTGQGVSGFNFDPQGAGGVGDYPTTYHFTDDNGCTDSIKITIHIQDPVPAVAGPPDSLCIFDGLLQLTGFSPVTGGTWSGTGITNTSAGIFDPLLAGGGLHPLIFSFGTGNCKLLDTTTVFVVYVPIEAGLDDAVCFADAPFDLTGFNPNSGGQWLGAGTSFSGNFSPQNAGVGPHVLTYQYEDNALGCVFKDSLTMTVHPMPESNFPAPNNTCIGDTVLLDNLSKSTFEVLWNFGDGQTSTLAEPWHIYVDTGTYTVNLLTTNEFGCSDQAMRTIFVTSPPFAQFSLMPDTGCAVLHVDFINQSYGWETSYVWKFGNFQIDSIINPTTVDFPGGTKDTTYYITLSATNICATRYWTDSVLVHPLPIAVFGTTTDTICSGETIFWANTSVGNSESFIWDFGNGLTSTDSLPEPVQYFTDTLFRNYTVRLIASNFCGDDTLERVVTVKPAKVKAFFNVPNYTGCQPYTVNFSNFSTPGVFSVWNFGDGNSSSDNNPTHTFQQHGKFKVVLKVSDGCGYDSIFANVTVLPAPVVNFKCNPKVCRGDELQFTNTSPDLLAGLFWDFGDGDTSILNNPTHIFDSAGIKIVTMTGVSAINGCPASTSLPVDVLELPNVNFSPDKPDGCVPLTINFQNQSQNSVYYEWDFDDGNTQPGATPTHTFLVPGKYEIRLRAIDLEGCRNDTVFRYITVHPKPSPSFEMLREHLCGVPVWVSFKNDTPDAVGYIWNFGDGSGNTTLNDPQHQFQTVGDFNISLIAENTFGCLDTTIQTFPAYAQPVADFIWLPEKGCVPLNVSFENLSSYATSAHWAFSDGGQSDSLIHTTYTFYQPGYYGTTLTVSHRSACFDTIELKNIIEVWPSPTAIFSFAEAQTEPPSGLFNFNDLSIDATRWLWDFGDGDSSDLQNPTHRYYSNGPKRVHLTVWGENNCTDDTLMTVTPRRMRGLFIPDAFTPGLNNGDAAYFLPKGIGLMEYHISVYSSFGTLVWESNALSAGRPAEGWDGTFRGENMPPDVYTWQLKAAVFDDGTPYDGKRIGSVTLIR